MSCEQIYGILLIPYVWTIVSAILYVLLKAGLTLILKCFVNYCFKPCVGNSTVERMENCMGDIEKQLMKCIECCSTKNEPGVKVNDKFTAEYFNLEYTSGISGKALSGGAWSPSTDDSDEKFFARVSENAKNRFKKEGGTIDLSAIAREAATVVADEIADPEGITMPSLNSCIDPCVEAMPEPCQAPTKSLWSSFFSAAAEVTSRAGDATGYFTRWYYSGSLERPKEESISIISALKVESAYKTKDEVTALLKKVREVRSDVAQWGRRLDVLYILLHPDGISKDKKIPFGALPSLDMLSVYFKALSGDPRAFSSACDQICWNGTWSTKIKAFKEAYDALVGEWERYEEVFKNENPLPFNLADLLPPKPSDEKLPFLLDVTVSSPFDSTSRSGLFDWSFYGISGAVDDVKRYKNKYPTYEQWRGSTDRSISSYDFDYYSALQEELKKLVDEAMKHHILDRWRRDTLIMSRYTDLSQFQGYWLYRTGKDVGELKGLTESFREEAKEWSNRNTEKTADPIEVRYLEMSFRDARKSLEASAFYLDSYKEYVGASLVSKVGGFTSYTKETFEEMRKPDELNCDRPDAGWRFWRMNAEQLTNVFEMAVSIAVFIICCTQIDKNDASKHFGMSNQYQQFYGLLVNSAFVETFISISIDYINAKECLSLCDRMAKKAFKPKHNEDDFKTNSGKYCDEYDSALIRYDLSGAVMEGEAIPGYGRKWSERPFVLFFLGVMLPMICSHVIPVIVLYPWVFLFLYGLVPIFTVGFMISVMLFNQWFFEQLKEYLEEKGWHKMGSCVTCIGKGMTQFWSFFFFKAFLPIFIQFCFVFLMQSTFTYGALLYNNFDATPGYSGLTAKDYIWVVQKDYALRTQTPCYLERAWAANNPKGLITFFSFI